MKDCEYVLGYFSELLIRKREYSFSRTEFVRELAAFCKRRVISLDVEHLFGVLKYNHIIVDHDGDCTFRFCYFLSYFAAHRMLHSPEFRDFVFVSENYSNYPEIIEFYTGSDRNREDAVRVLTEGIKRANDVFEKRFSFPDIPDPYRHYKWFPKEEDIELMRLELDEALQIAESSERAKDQAADSFYDQSRPYNQRISSILEDYSLVLMVQAMKGGARALRNSDYVDPDLKRALLDEIFRAWGNLIKTLILLAPLLANDKQATYEGMAFMLGKGFSDTPIARFKEIMGEIHRNVVEWHYKDLHSKKMAPLLIEHLSKGHEWIEHCVALILLKTKPPGWDKAFRDHVLSLDKNSFYLWSIYGALRTNYRLGFMSDTDVKKVAVLIKTAGAKHLTGTKRAGPVALKKISDKNIPEREV